MSGTPHRIPNVAVTGGIACGKSALGFFLSELGADVMDADEVVHELQCPGGAIALAVADEFGPEYMTPDGAVDRSRLGARVFRDSAALARLNALSHPLVRARLGEWRDAPAETWCRVALIPLLFESGWERDWDYTVCVFCGEAVQMDRMRARGWTEADSRQRLSAQLPLSEKMRRADYSIRNDGTMEDLRREAEKLKQHLTSIFTEAR